MQKQMGLGKSKHLVQLLATVSFGHCRQLSIQSIYRTHCNKTMVQIF